MAKVITFSTKFPDYHPRKNEPTFFVEKILNSLGYAQFKKDIPIGVRHLVNDFVILDGQQKHHTIRAGNRWKVGDKFSPRIWSGAPYRSKQIIIGPDIEVKKVWDFEMKPSAWWDECRYSSKDFVTTAENLKAIATNDGLTLTDFAQWFAGKGMMSSKRKPFRGQIICWNENLEY